MGFKNGHRLWSADKLKQQIAWRQHEYPLVIVDARRAEEYANGHIPGARHFDPVYINTTDTDDAPMKNFTQMFRDLFEWRGMTDNQMLVIYGYSTDMYAARLFWAAEYLGYRRAIILDGGWHAWKSRGYKIERHIPTTNVPKNTTFRGQTKRQVVATYKDMLLAINNPEFLIWDTRSHKEHIGKDKRGAERGGTIPSAKFSDCKRLRNQTTGCLSTYDEVMTILHGLGEINQKKRVLCLGSTGYRSAFAYFVLRLVGIPVANYVGSWNEWGNRAELPIEKKSNI